MEIERAKNSEIETFKVTLHDGKVKITQLDAYLHAFRVNMQLNSPERIPVIDARKEASYHQGIGKKRMKLLQRDREQVKRDVRRS